MSDTISAENPVSARETALAFPKPDVEVDASALSTLRVSFGAIPSAVPPEQPG